MSEEKKGSSWEFNCRWAPPNIPLQTEIENLSSEGWELVTMAERTNGLQLVYRRRKVGTISLPATAIKKS